MNQRCVGVVESIHKTNVYLLRYFMSFFLISGVDSSLWSMSGHFEESGLKSNGGFRALLQCIWFDSRQPAIECALYLRPTMVSNIMVIHSW